MVKAECQRRIEARYPVWKQLNVAEEGGEGRAEMRAFIDAHRAASNRIEAMRPIPHDFAADHHWN
jgi:hypothetical protein